MERACWSTTASSMCATSNHWNPLAVTRCRPRPTLRTLLPAGQLVASSPTTTFWLNPLTGLALRQYPFPTTEVASNADGSLSLLTGDIAAAVSRVDADGQDATAARRARCRPTAAPGPRGFTALPTTSGSQGTASGRRSHHPRRDGFARRRAGCGDRPRRERRRQAFRRVAAGRRRRPVAHVGPQRRRAAVVLVPTAAWSQRGCSRCTRTRADYHAFNVWNAASGDLLRVFGADVRALAASADAGQLATREGSGLALWCR